MKSTVLYKALLFGVIALTSLSETQAYDLNNDGYEDIVVVNQNDQQGNYNIDSYIFWGDATKSFSQKTALPTIGAYCATVSDLNNDNHLDIIFSNYYNGSTFDLNSYIYWGDTNNTYSTKTELATKGAVGNSVADINNDGYNDIVFSNIRDGGNYSTNSYIYWGNSSYTYSTKTELPTHAGTSNAIADINNDGFLDILFSNYKDSTQNTNSFIYWGDESYTYSQKKELPTFGGWGNSISDLNKDGFLDIVFSNYGVGASLPTNSYIYWGDANSDFSSKTELRTNSGYGNSAGDLDNDGYIDIVFSNYSDGSPNTNSYIYWGDENNTYSTRTELATKGALGNALADLDNDGYLDIVFCNLTDGTSTSPNSFIYWGSSTRNYSSITEIYSPGATGVAAGTMSSFGQSIVDDFTTTDAIPEPASIMLLGLSLVGILRIKIRK